MSPRQRAILDALAMCGGSMEAQKDDWPIIDRLVKKELVVWVSDARGPGKAFKRVSLLRQQGKPPELTNAERLLLRRALSSYMQRYRDILLIHTDPKDKQVDRDNIAAAEALSNKLMDWRA